MFFNPLYQNIHQKLVSLDSIKIIEWYLGQDHQKGGILNTPCVLIKFDPASVERISKTALQSKIRFELLIYTDFKKSQTKITKPTTVHFELEAQILSVLSRLELISITPVERFSGLLKSSMTFVFDSTIKLQNTGNDQSKLVKILPKVNKSLKDSL